MTMSCDWLIEVVHPFVTSSYSWQETSACADESFFFQYLLWPLWMPLPCWKKTLTNAGQAGQDQVDTSSLKLHIYCTFFSSTTTLPPLDCHHFAAILLTFYKIAPVRHLPQFLSVFYNMLAGLVYLTLNSTLF